MSSHILSPFRPLTKLMKNLFHSRSASITLRYIITIAFLSSVVSCSTNNIDKKSNSTGQTVSSKAKKTTYFNEPVKVMEEYVNRVGKRLLIVADDITIDYHFHVSAELIPNIWVNTPTEIAITTGMLEKLNSEAELAHVLAHEIFQASQGGYREKIYSVDELLAADDFAVRHLILAGFNPKAALSLHKVLGVSEEDPESLWHVGYLVTHPSHSMRSNSYKKAVLRIPKGLETGEDRYAEELIKLSNG